MGHETAVEDRQRVEQLVPEQCGAARIEGERRRAADRGPHAREWPVVRLEAPDRDHYRPRHPVFRFDALEQRVVRHGRVLARAIMRAVSL